MELWHPKLREKFRQVEMPSRLALAVAEACSTNIPSGLAGSKERRVRRILAFPPDGHDSSTGLGLRNSDSGSCFFYWESQIPSTVCQNGACQTAKPALA